MKIRQGFVSNSSTTSFCIYGAKFEPTRDEEKEASQDWYDPYDDMYEQCNKVDLVCESPPYDDYCYIGISWSSIGDDETGSQFKARVEGKLFRLFGIRPIQCGTHEDAWRDG